MFILLLRNVDIMSFKCFLCPKKPNLKDLKKAIICKGCDNYYHKSCADRAGRTESGSFRKCCAKKLPNIITLESSKHTKKEIPTTSYSINQETKSTELKLIIENNNLFENIKNYIDDGVVTKLNDLIEKFDDYNSEVDSRLSALESQVADITLITTETVIAEMKKKKIEKNL